MRIRFNGLIEIENDLSRAEEKLLAADTNAALTCINKALKEVRAIRTFFENPTTEEE